MFFNAENPTKRKTSIIKVIRVPLSTEGEIGMVSLDLSSA
jgi:hypothetical protein